MNVLSKARDFEVFSDISVMLQWNIYEALIFSFSPSDYSPEQKAICKTTRQLVIDAMVRFVSWRWPSLFFINALQGDLTLSDFNSIVWKWSISDSQTTARLDLLHK